MFWRIVCALCCQLQLNATLLEDNVLLDTVSVYETEPGEYRATFIIEFTDPNTDVMFVEARLNIGLQRVRETSTQRRKRQTSQSVVLNPDIAQSQGFIVSSKHCTM